MYYADKIESLQDIFGTPDVTLEPGFLVVRGARYPILDDVIVLSRPDQYSDGVRRRLGMASYAPSDEIHAAADIQYTFGAEWQRYDRVLPEHEGEFRRYFDLVDLAALEGLRLCDLGCGSGRWSYYLRDIAGEIVLVDFSDAIWVARRNLARAGNCLFFMGDLKDLPFRDDFADFLFCLGVLHHLPTPCLDEVRALRRWAPTLLIYLYYALDNRAFYFRVLLQVVTAMRRYLYRVRSPAFRKAFALAGALTIYEPLILLGRLLAPLNLGSRVPLYDFYHDKGVQRIQQDVYDRFFTRIEQRVSRAEILALRECFSSVQVSDDVPYWHFLCRR